MIVGHKEGDREGQGHKSGEAGLRFRPQRGTQTTLIGLDLA